ncbi:hypothetical protein VHUM_02626 [Vanrija humicola]|uniref:Uncharacterized protein n=1 Tax=Vanrija humicola TaxID=5417 RepID=A0A7D8V0L0_VANHU|nr:hypothetical protein VHUM_02626 [Vanrija humicola]
MGGRYVPPHLRNRPAGAAPGPSASPSATPSHQPRQQQHDAGPSSPPQASRGWSTQSGPGPSRRPPGHRGGGGGGGAGRGGGRSLYIFGDSFVGPFKLLADSHTKTQTFKGASAKGLNNPKSIKQVSNELVPLLNNLLAPPPYAYLPPTGRFALLIFGNVDLQINYLWQLQHKPITAATFAATGKQAEADSAAEAPASAEDNILATATENSGKGPALGPDSFVDVVIKAYTGWLEREIVNGPIGRRALEVQKQAQDPSVGQRRLTPTRVLVAAALPPLVEDPILPRIPEKYVERMEEDHVRAQQALERGERDRGSRWSARGAPAPPAAGLEQGLEALSLNGNDSAAPTPPNGAKKTTVDQLLKHDPVLCTKPIRIVMTRKYNAALKEFCAKYPHVLTFVDISDVMLNIDKEEREAAKKRGDAGEDEVERATWGCPVDPSNIHPLWEPTLPLWLDTLAGLGLPTETFPVSQDAEKTFKAYEEDKRRRTEGKVFGTPAEGDQGRLKLRDE